MKEEIGSRVLAPLDEGFFGVNKRPGKVVAIEDRQDVQRRLFRKPIILKYKVYTVHFDNRVLMAYQTFTRNQLTLLESNPKRSE